MLCTHRDVAFYPRFSAFPIGVGASPCVRPCASERVHREAGARKVTPLRRSYNTASIYYTFITSLFICHCLLTVSIYLQPLLNHISLPLPGVLLYTKGE